jgi:hypothetical protein
MSTASITHRPSAAFKPDPPIRGHHVRRRTVLSLP